MYRFHRYMLVRNLNYGRKRFLTSSTKLFAKPKLPAAKTGSKSVINEPEPVRDTQLLVKKCCGASKMKDQEDPDIKPDSEYPEWLWSIHVGKPRLYHDYNSNTKEYWYELERHKEEQRNLPRKAVTFYKEPREHEITFVSRIADREHAEPVHDCYSSNKFELHFNDRLPLKGPVIGDS